MERASRAWARFVAWRERRLNPTVKVVEAASNAQAQRLIAKHEKQGYRLESMSTTPGRLFLMQKRITLILRKTS